MDEKIAKNDQSEKNGEHDMKEIEEIKMINERLKERLAQENLHEIIKSRHFARNYHGSQPVLQKNINQLEDALEQIVKSRKPGKKFVGDKDEIFM